MLADFTESVIGSDVKVIDRDFDLTKCNPIDENAKNDVNILVFGDDYMVCQYVPGAVRAINIYKSIANNIIGLEPKHIEFIIKRYGGILGVKGKHSTQTDFNSKFMLQNIIIKQDMVQEFDKCKDKCSCNVVYTVAHMVLTIAAMRTSSVLRLNGNIDRCTFNHRQYLLQDF